MEYESFGYEPLQLRHIRLLEFTSSPIASVVSCKCIHVALDDHSQEYVTVSYAWGSVEKPCQMVLNGQTLNITKTVHDIFRSGIAADPNTRLWIDAICINQEDLVEKASQWLGLASLDSDLAIHFTKTLFSILPELETGDPERLKFYYSLYPDGCQEWIALGHFLNRPWFSRTWVIQEIALATCADVVCGDAIIAWDVLERVIVGLTDMGFGGLIYTTAANKSTEPVLVNGLPGHDAFNGLCRVRTLVKARKPRPLLRVMATFQRSLSTERNDKIYAILGVVTDADNGIFYPDYAKPSETLFQEVTQFMITRDANLDALRYAGLEKGDSTSSAPSWSMKDSPSDQRPSRLGQYSVTTVKKPNFSFSDDNNCLRLRGFIFDMVYQLGHLLRGFEEGQTPGEDETFHDFDWFCQARSTAQSTGRGGKDWWRTLLGNKIIDTNDVSFESPESLPDQSWEADFMAFESIYALIQKSNPEEARQLITSHDGVKALRFRGQMSRATAYRRFCVLSSGSLALMPSEAQLGDVVAAFLGAKVLFAVRPLHANKDGSPQYHLVGECYVHDRMDGQVMNMGLESQDIELV